MNGRRQFYDNGPIGSRDYEDGGSYEPSQNAQALSLDARRMGAFHAERDAAKKKLGRDLYLFEINAMQAAIRNRIN